jgi:hypothetical protein
MQLNAAQQEYYARHLILDGFGGEGQERLLAAAVRVRGEGVAALWAARYLSASGIGRLQIDVAAWRDELLLLGPWLEVVLDAPLQIEPREGEGPAESAVNGAQAALEMVRAIAQGAAR